MVANIPSVISNVVANDLCIGCGACIDICPSNALKMDWDGNGLLIPTQVNNCCNDKSCLTVCPFDPKNATTVSDLTETYIKDKESLVFNESIGYYASLYAGHSVEFRESSSSGGVGTWVVSELFKAGLIDYAISVKTIDDARDSHFAYQIISKLDDVKTISKTKYYPTSLAGIFDYVVANQGNYVLTGLPCFLKSVRLFQNTNIVVKDRIKFLIGITCGGLKSRFFTEYLAWKLDIMPTYIVNPEYRVKTFAKTAGDYSFSVNKDLKLESIKMSTIGDTWGNGSFKANACDYCDDIFAELADISVGDAWIDPYIQDKGGANIIIVRSKLIDNIVKKGIINSQLTLVNESEDRIISTQKANFSHRREGLQYRLQWQYNKGLEIKGKRVNRRKFGDWSFKKVQKIRMSYRETSFDAWKKQKLDFSKNTYDSEMLTLKNRLSYYTKIRNFFRSTWSRRVIAHVFSLIMSVFSK